MHNVNSAHNRTESFAWLLILTHVLQCSMHSLFSSSSPPIRILLGPLYYSNKLTCTIVVLRTIMHTRYLHNIHVLYSNSTKKHAQYGFLTLFHLNVLVVRIFNPQVMWVDMRAYDVKIERKLRATSNLPSCAACCSIHSLFSSSLPTSSLHIYVLRSLYIVSLVPSAYTRVYSFITATATYIYVFIRIQLYAHM